MFNRKTAKQTHVEAESAHVWKQLKQCKEILKKLKLTGGRNSQK